LSSATLAADHLQRLAIIAATRRQHLIQHRRMRRQMLGRQMRIPLNHLLCLPAASKASWVESICSATVIGTAGLSFLRGSEPVIATLMMQGEVMVISPASG
jgi:hypothetical protein